MASTFSTNLGIELISTGDQSGTWGTSTNSNFTNVFEESIVGRTAITFTDADVTLTQVPANTNQAYRNLYLSCTGTNTAQRNLIVPTINKTYVVENNTTGGFAIVVKTSAGTGITIPNGYKTAVYADGTNVVQAWNYLPSVTLGTALAAASGGTGQASYTTGDLLYATGSTALSKLGIGTSGQILTSTGTAPQWSTLSGVAVTTFQTSLSGLTPSVATSGAVTLAGTLGTSSGGTGLTSFTANGVLYASGTGTLATGSALTFDGTNLSTTGNVTLANNKNYQVQNTTGTAQVLLTLGSDNNVYMGQVTSPTAASLYLYGLQQIFNANGAEGMRLTSTGLGIGTSSPVYKLQVIGASQIQTNAAGTQQVLQLNNSDTTAGTQAVKLGFSSGGTTKSSINAAVYNNDYMTFNVGSDTERMRLDSSGNLGLGVTPSATTTGYKALQVGALSTLLYRNDINSTEILNNASNNSGYVYQTTAPATLYRQANGAHSWFYVPSGTAGNAITFTQALTLDASGRLLVGTTSAAGSNLLQVNSDALINGTTFGRGGGGVYGNIAIGISAGDANTTGTYNTTIGYQAGHNTTSASSNTYVGASAGQNMTSGSNIAIGFNTLTGSGTPASNTGAQNVAVGAYAGGSITSGANNQLYGYNAGNFVTTGSNNVMIGNGAGLVTSGGSYINATTTGSTNIYIGSFAIGSFGSNTREIVIGYDSAGKGSNTGYINPNGGGVYQGNNSSSWSVTSDARIKKNLAPVVNGLDVINALKPTAFDYIVTGKHDIGFIAQEYMEVLPEQVSKHAASEEEQKLAGEAEIYGIQQNLVPYLVSAIQTLTARIAKLEAK